MYSYMRCRLSAEALEPPVPLYVIILYYIIYIINHIFLYALPPQRRGPRSRR